MINKAVLVFCLAFIGFSFGNDDVTHSYAGNYVYEGNPSGKFKDDLVAVLEGGSEWKVLERQEGRFSKWEIGETARIKLRKSKEKDQKLQYRLYNYERDEAVKVMPLSLGDDPLKIVYASLNLLANPDFIPFRNI